MEILRPKNDSKNDELTLQHVEEHEGLIIYMNPRGAKKEGQQKYADPRAGIIKPPARFFWKNPVPLSLVIDGGDGVTELFGVVDFFRHGYSYFSLSN